MPRSLALLLLLAASPSPARTPATPTERPEPARESAVPASQASRQLGPYSCTRHSDCTESSVPGPITRAEDCACLAHFAGSTFSVPSREAAIWADAFTRLCAPVCEAQCCPPLAHRDLGPRHAACLAGVCVLNRGAALTRDELAEEASGRGTDSPGECLLDADCTLTQFPSGLQDPQGRPYCPVCPRFGGAVEARTESTQPFVVQQPDGASAACPKLSCEPTLARCEKHRCVITPERAPIEPPRVEQFVAPPIPPLPEKPVLPAPFDRPVPPELQCRAHQDCVFASETCMCTCGPEKLVNRRHAARLEKERPTRCPAGTIGPCPPCAMRITPPSPACVRGACVTESQRSDWEHYQKATAAWPAELAAARLARKEAERRAAEVGRRRAEGSADR